MSEKRLPFVIDVEMRAYHNKSFPLGIIKANIIDYELWLCNKLINCVFRANSCSFDILEDDLWSVKEGLIFSQNMYVEPQFFTNKAIDLIELNKSMIDDDYYITGAYNEFYIPKKKPYKSYDFNHDYILIGYCDKKQIFNSVAYLKNGMYKEFEIPFEDYLNGVVKNDIAKTNLNFYKVKRNFEPTVNLCFIKEKLIDYLKSKNGNHTGSVDTYGIDTWNELINYIEGKGKLDPRFGRVFMEHKAIMLNRFIQLKERNLLNDVKLVREYEKVYFDACRVHNLFVKFNIQYNKSILDTITKIIENIREKEEYIIKEVIAGLP